MADRLDGKVAFITGGCSGIGLAMTETFIAEGGRVVVGDLQEDKGADLSRRYPEALRFLRCDVSSEQDIAAAIAVAVTEFGGLDITCNNAGTAGPNETIETIGAEQWDRCFAILLRGPLLGIKHSIPAMRARGGGSIINTASIAGLQGGFGAATYAVAKAGLIQLTRRAAAECAADRIRINTLCPGFVPTPIYGDNMGLSRNISDAIALELDHGFETLQPLPYGGLPQDVAEAALFLASSSARFVTGTEIVVDGGALIKLRVELRPDIPGSFSALLEAARKKVMDGS